MNMNLEKLVDACYVCEEFTPPNDRPGMHNDRIVALIPTRFVNEVRFRMKQMGLEIISNRRRLNCRLLYIREIPSQD